MFMGLPDADPARPTGAYVRGESRATEAIRDVTSSGRGPVAEATIVRGPDRGRCFSLVRRDATVLGRNHSFDIPLLHPDDVNPTVSARHAEIRGTESRLRPSIV
jgi:hypothetical protein